VKIYWDYANKRLLSSIATRSFIDLLELCLRDQELLTIYPVALDEEDNTYTAVAFPSGWTPKMEIKATDDRDADPAPAGALIWVLDADHYNATLDLNTTQLIAVVESVDNTNTYLDMVAEITLENAAGENRNSTQVPARITPDVRRIGTTPPTSAAAWPWLQEFVFEGHKCLRFKNSDGVTLLELAPPGVTLP
jgi:hypothetical protein